MNCKVHPDEECEHFQSIGVASSASLYGPWKRHPRPVLEPDPCSEYEAKWRKGKYNGEWRVVANPSVVFNDDDSLFLFYRGVEDTGVLLATAPRWDQTPYRRLGGGRSIFYMQGRKLEDMFAWRTATGCNMMMHVHSGPRCRPRSASLDPHTLMIPPTKQIQK